jgi:hypothetical protein
MPLKPMRTESKVRLYRSWFAFVGFDLRKWVFGFYFDVAPTCLAIDLGPLFLRVERDDPLPTSYVDLPDWGRTLRRIVIRKWKLELRFDLDLNIWRLGYMMADIHDHGIYFGPFNLQIEYDKFFDHFW